MSKYDDLIKMIRNEVALFNPSVVSRSLALDAADAIEELQKLNCELLFRVGQAEALIDYYQTGRTISNEPPKEKNERGILMTELKDTVRYMTSEDWRLRFIAEYLQVKIRYEKLHRMIVRREVGMNDFNTPIPLESWKAQALYMGMYLYELEKQAAIHGIPLPNIYEPLNRQMEDEV